MKTLLLLGLVFTTSAMATVTCKSDYPVTLIEKDNKEMSLKVSGNLVKNNSVVGGVALVMSTADSTYLEIKGTELYASLIRKEGEKTVEEKWVKVGNILASDKGNKEVCHQVNLLKGFYFEESVKSFKASCFPLPSSMCGKQKSAFLNLKINEGSKVYYTPSIISIM